MIPRDAEMTEDDDAAPIEMLAALFEARSWQSEIVADNEMVGEVQGSWAKYQLRAIWRGEDNVLQFLCLPDIPLGVFGTTQKQIQWHPQYLRHADIDCR